MFGTNTVKFPSLINVSVKKYSVIQEKLLFFIFPANLSDSIRLVNGSDKTNGRLEVRIDGRGAWGTVCGLGFFQNEAKVACKELGLPT